MRAGQVMHNGVFNLLTCERIPPEAITGLCLCKKEVIGIQYKHHDNCVGFTDLFITDKKGETNEI